MDNPIRDILHDMDMEFTSTIPLSDEQIEEVYRKYAKIVKGAVVDEFVAKCKAQNTIGISVLTLDRISSEYKGE